MEPKEAYWAIVDPEGYLGIDKEPPKLTSFQFGGEPFNVGDKTEFDVNVPNDVTHINFSSHNVSHEYAEGEVDIDVTLQPENGAVRAGEPAVATVKIAWKDAPHIATTYTIHFGHMTAEWDVDENYPDTGYCSTVHIRFSDGKTAPKLFQVFYDEDGTVKLMNSDEFQPLPKHASGTFTIRTENPIDKDELKTLTLKKFLWDQNWKPIISARVTDFRHPEQYWKLAKSIESGKTYIVVSTNSGKALTNMNVATVPATGGVSHAKRGLAATPVMIVDDIIVEPKEIQDNMRFIFTEKESPDPGRFTKENGYTGYTMLSLVHGGLIAPSIMWRDVSEDNTAALRTDLTIGDDDLDRAVWFHTEFDQETGETTLFSHTGSSNQTYAIHGNDVGFVAEGGTEPLEKYAAVSRVKLFEFVTDATYEELSNLGTEIKLEPDARLVHGHDNEITVTADVPDGATAVLKKDGKSIATTEFEDGKATISVKAEDIETDANFAIVVYDASSDILGAVIVPVVTVDSATPTATVEKLRGNMNKLIIIVTEQLTDGTSTQYKEEFMIRNNAADVYQVGPYKVYVNTKGNDQIRECYIVS